VRTHSTIFGPETEHNPPSRKRKFHYIVKIIPLDSRPFGLDDLCEEEYVEAQLAELTENGERVVAITRDHEDLMVVLMTAQGGVA